MHEAAVGSPGFAPTAPIDHASPLIDDELIVRRMRQRRTVRQIPAWIVSDVASEAGLTSIESLRNHPDRVLMEMHLRDVADRLLGQMHLALNDLMTATLAAAAECFYAAAGDTGLELLTLERQNVDREPAVAKYMRCDRDFRKIENVDHEALAALITTVSWADELAGDYRDPRIASCAREPF